MDQSCFLLLLFFVLKVEKTWKSVQIIPFCYCQWLISGTFCRQSRNTMEVQQSVRPTETPAPQERSNPDPSLPAHNDPGQTAA